MCDPTQWPNDSTPGFISNIHKWLYAPSHLYENLLSSPNLETTEKSINSKMGEPWRKNKQHSHTTFRNESQGYNIEWKKPRYKRPHTLCFHLSEIQKQAKLLYGEWSSHRWGLGGAESGWGVLKIFCPDPGGGYTSVHIQKVQFINYTTPKKDS